MTGGKLPRVRHEPDIKLLWAAVYGQEYARVKRFSSSDHAHQQALVLADSARDAARKDPRFQ